MTIFSQIKSSVNSILPTLYNDTELTTPVTWKVFSSSVFNEELGYNEDTYISFTNIRAIRLEREMGASMFGRTFDQGNYSLATGEVQFLFQHSDVPASASIRDLVVDGDTGLLYSVKKIWPVFGLITKVEVKGYA